MSRQCLRQDGIMLDLYDWAQSSCVSDPEPTSPFTIIIHAIAWYYVTSSGKYHKVCSQCCVHFL